MSNSTVFEQVASGEISPSDAAKVLLDNDDLARRNRVKDAKPHWMPTLAWAVASVLIVAFADWLRRHTTG